MHAELYIRAAKYDKARRSVQNFTCKVSKMTGEISDASFCDMVDAGNIKGCPVNRFGLRVLAIGHPAKRKRSEVICFT